MHKVDIDHIPFNALHHSYPPLIIIYASNKMLKHYLQRGWDLAVRFCSEKVSTSIKTRVFRCHFVSDNPNVNREKMIENLSAWYCISQNISLGLHEGTLFINILLIQKDKMNPMDTIIAKFECIFCS